MYSTPKNITTHTPKLHVRITLCRVMPSPSHRSQTKCPYIILKLNNAKNENAVCRRYTPLHTWLLYIHIGRVEGDAHNVCKLSTHYGHCVPSTIVSSVGTTEFNNFKYRMTTTTT